MVKALIVQLLIVSAAFGSSEIVEQQISSSRLSSSRPAGSLIPMYLEDGVDSNYIIGPGDFFDIYVEGTVVSLQVSPEGSLAIERVGLFHLSGKSVDSAKAILSKALKSAFPHSECFVQLTQLKRFRIQVQGAVKNPGQYPVDGNQRLSALFRVVGGTLPLANLSDIWIIRNGDTLHVNFKSINSSPNGSTQDPTLYQGDLVFVPYQKLGVKSILIINHDEVVKEQFDSTKVFRDVLIDAGFYSRQSLPDRIRIESLHGKMIMEGSLDSLADFKSKEPYRAVLLESTERQIKKVYIAGMVGRIGAVDYVEGYSPMDYIAAAGMTPYSGSIDQIDVIRYSNAKRDRIDPIMGIVYAGDVLELPRSNYERIKDVTVFLATLLGVLSSTLVIYQAFR